MSAVGTNFTHLYKIATAASFELLESNSLSDVDCSAAPHHYNQSYSLDSWYGALE